MCIYIIILCTYTLQINLTDTNEGTSLAPSVGLYQGMCLFDVYVRTLFSGEKVLRGSE